MRLSAVTITSVTMSAIPRLFVRADLVKDGPVALDPEQSKYLFRVMRLGKGAHIRLFNGRDGEWLAEIDTQIGKSVGVLKVIRRLRPQDALIDLHLMFAPLKKTRTDFVVEKATELGVSVFYPVMTLRTNAAQVRSDRLTKIALEAAEQTGRLDTPVVEEAQTLNKALQDWPEARTLYFCDEAGDDPDEKWGGEAGRAAPFRDVLQGRETGPTTILIGPEGGFTPEERHYLRTTPGVVPVTLGPRILRAETAALAALSLWQAFHGDWVAKTALDVTNDG